MRRCLQQQQRIMLFSLFLLLFACEKKHDQTTMTVLTVADLLANERVDGYERAIEPRHFHFPEDHGSHPSFRNEWWYVTGNVHSEQGQEFGYQITLFRTAFSPLSSSLLVDASSNHVLRPSRWTSKQVWMAHVALTDISAQHYYHQQRFSREALGLAGFQRQPFKIWLEDWQITAKENGVFPWQIHIQHGSILLDLTLAATKSPVLQGDHGLSQKSEQKGNASYYYSMTQLQTTGQIMIDNKAYTVHGKSWLDREWSTSALGKNQVGWDWFALQFDNNTELMYYQMRTKSGQADPHSVGKYINGDNRTVTIAANQMQLTPLKMWRSSITRRRYPIVWRMHLPTLNKTWRIEAQLNEQEMIGIVHYWEGAVRVIDEKTKRQVGKGYLEMTGYE